MDVLRYILYVVLLLGSVFLILLVLIQRGKGGGLAGALGGMGGYSAFGTRAGDLFTRITIVAASIWILCAMALAKISVSGSPYDNPGVTAEPETDSKAPSDDTIKGSGKSADESEGTLPPPPGDAPPLGPPASPAAPDESSDAKK